MMMEQEQEQEQEQKKPASVAGLHTNGAAEGLTPKFGFNFVTFLLSRDFSN